MSQYDLKITNGTVANSAETFQTDIGIKDGKVVAISKNLGDAKRAIDAGGKYVLPGALKRIATLSRNRPAG